MNWNAIGAVGETLGAVAVLVSLVYLAVQIRQNTRMLRASALSSTTNTNVAFNYLLGGDPAVARVFQVGLEDFKALSEDEQRQFLNLIRASLISYEHVYQSFDAGLISDEVWLRYLRAAKHLIQIPHIAVWWEARRAAYTPSFVEALDRAPDVPQHELASFVIRAMLVQQQDRT